MNYQKHWKLFFSIHTYNLMEIYLNKYWAYLVEEMHHPLLPIYTQHEYKFNFNSFNEYVFECHCLSYNYGQTPPYFVILDNNNDNDNNNDDNNDNNNNNDDDYDNNSNNNDNDYSHNNDANNDNNENNNDKNGSDSMPVIV